MRNSRVARRLTNTVALFVGFSISSYDDEGNVGDEIEYQNKHLEQSDEGVDCYVERFFGDREPSAVDLVDPITGAGTDQKRQNQQRPVHNRAPHEESSDVNDIHNVSPFSVASNIIILWQSYTTRYSPF